MESFFAVLMIVFVEWIFMDFVCRRGYKLCRRGNRKKRCKNWMCFLYEECPFSKEGYSKDKHKDYFDPDTMNDIDDLKKR